MRRSKRSLILPLLSVMASLFYLPSTLEITDSTDVKAVKKLFGSLNYALPLGEDPCGDSWVEVQCLGSSITEIRLGERNMDGELGEGLLEFGNIVTIDLKMNHIHGSIPLNLPKTLQNIDFSDNELTGNIPKNLSLLNHLETLSFSRNKLVGPIPDSFQHLTHLTNLYLSNNNLKGELPSSMEYLSALSTLHLQNNELNGELEVLQNLHLRDLNIENNGFSGPIPKAFSFISNFSYKGNNKIDPTTMPSSGVGSHSSKAPSPEGHPGMGLGRMTQPPAYDITRGSEPPPPPSEALPFALLYAPPPPPISSLLLDHPHPTTTLPSMFKVLLVLFIVIVVCVCFIFIIQKGTTSCRNY